MIIVIYRCDLCKKDVEYPYGGYRLSYSGCGGIGFEFLDTEDKNISKSVICKNCAHGLRYALSHIPKSPYED